MTKPEDLTPSQQWALRDCANYPPGKYVWKRVTMRKLSALGLTRELDGGAYALTTAGEHLVDQLRGPRRQR